MGRRVTRQIRERLFARSTGCCERAGCGLPITFDSFHVAHLRAFVHGGASVEANLAAWCARCNLVNGAHDVADTRTPAREWQLQALEVVVPRILATGAATLSAAPAAGKTMFAGLVFMRLEELDVIDRVVVLVPRNTLVKQWTDSLHAHTHLELRPGSPYEREGQVGCVVTYHSLQNREERRNHADQVRKKRTLLVLDEVHHVGEPARAGGALPAWARYVTELAGSTEGKLNVAAILNLSGTLWRSLPRQRISTVRYETLADGSLLSQVDYDIDAVRLIREKHLRPIDLRRMGASVRLNDYRDLRVIDSHTADLNEKPHGRAVLRGLARDAQWRRAFVTAVLDRLIVQYRSLQNHHVKALIVAANQYGATLLCETANELMKERGLAPLAMIATSDLTEAQKTLEDFRTMQKPGILCTVDMAGEGYDCPDICVIGYASNKQTPLYIRQVVARAQRRTARERELAIDMPAVVVAPEVPELIELLVGILSPMYHEIAPEEPAGEQREPREGGSGSRDPAFELTQVTPDADSAASIAEDREWQVPGRTVAHVERALEDVGLPPAQATRTIYAMKKAAEAQRVASPFEPLNQFELTFEQIGEPTSKPRGASTARAMTEEEKVANGRRFLTKAAGWWTRYGPEDVPVEQFNYNVNAAADIPRGGRNNATLAQLRTGARYAQKSILARCAETGMQAPNFSEWIIK